MGSPEPAACLQGQLAPRRAEQNGAGGSAGHLRAAHVGVRIMRPPAPEPATAFVLTLPPAWGLHGSPEDGAAMATEGAGAPCLAQSPGSRSAGCSPRGPRRGGAASPKCSSASDSLQYREEGTRLLILRPPSHPPAPRSSRPALGHRPPMKPWAWRTPPPHGRRPRGCTQDLGRERGMAEVDPGWS